VFACPVGFVFQLCAVSVGRGCACLCLSDVCLSGVCFGLFVGVCRLCVCRLCGLSASVGCVLGCLSVSVARVFLSCGGRGVCLCLSCVCVCVCVCISLSGPRHKHLPVRTAFRCLFKLNAGVACQIQA
jgi:hypothetical protein